MNATGKLHPSGDPLELLDVHYRRHPLGTARAGQLDVYGYDAGGKLYEFLDSPIMLAKGGAWAPARYPTHIFYRERVEIR